MGCWDDIELHEIQDKKCFYPALPRAIPVHVIFMLTYDMVKEGFQVSISIPLNSSEYLISPFCLEAEDLN